MKLLPALLISLVPALALAQAPHVGPLQAQNSLSEIQAGGSAAQALARGHIGLGNAATLNVGTAAGTVAAGNDARIPTGAAGAANGAVVNDTNGNAATIGITAAEHLTGTGFESNIHVTTTAVGSGVNGPGTAQNGMSVRITKDNWNSTTTPAAVGEIDGISVTTRQGGAGSDTSGLLIDAQNTGLGFLSMTEMVSNILNPSTGLITQGMDIQEGGLNAAANSYIGAVYTATTGALTNALLVQDEGGSTSWGNVLTNIKSGTINFNIDGNGNITKAGNITASGSVTASSMIVGGTTLNQAAVLNAAADASPGSTGISSGATVNLTTANWLYLTTSGGNIAAATLNLPSTSGLLEGQRVKVVFGGGIQAITWTSTDSKTIIGAPTSAVFHSGSFGSVILIWTTVLNQWTAYSTDNYSLPAASASTLGGVIIGSNISLSSGTISLTAANVDAALGFTPLQAIPAIANNEVLGNISGASATPTGLTQAQLTALLVPGSIPGNTSGGSATAGSIGEHISSTVLIGAAVSLTSTAATDVASIALTPGDWDVSGTICFTAGAATATTVLRNWIYTVPTAAPTPPNAGAYSLIQAPFTVGAGQCEPVGTTPMLLTSAWTTVYLETAASFAGGTLGAYGYISARRAQ